MDTQRMTTLDNFVAECETWLQEIIECYIGGIKLLHPEFNKSFSYTQSVNLTDTLHTTNSIDQAMTTEITATTEISSTTDITMTADIVPPTIEFTSRQHTLLGMIYRYCSGNICESSAMVLYFLTVCMDFRLRIIEAFPILCKGSHLRSIH